MIFKTKISIVLTSLIAISSSGCIVKQVASDEISGNRLGSNYYMNKPAPDPYVDYFNKQEEVSKTQIVQQEAPQSVQQESISIQQQAQAINQPLEQQLQTQQVETSTSDQQVHTQESTTNLGIVFTEEKTNNISNTETNISNIEMRGGAFDVKYPVSMRKKQMFRYEMPPQNESQLTQEPQQQPIPSSNQTSQESQ